jgi:hypothetical protein
LKLKKKIIGWLIFREKIFLSGNNNEKVAKMLLVPKLAASRPANSRAINYSIQLCMGHLAKHL